MMGNNRFRLSDMIPNAWFYKLRDMGRTRNHNTTHPTKKNQTPTSSSSSTPLPSKANQPHPASRQRKSYYYTRELTTPPSVDTTLHNDLPRNTNACDTHFREPPRKSSNKRQSSTRRNRASPRPSPRLVTSSVSASCTYQTSLESIWIRPDSTPEEYPNTPIDSSSDLESVLPEFDGTASWPSSCQCKTNNNVDINMDNKKSFTRKSVGFQSIYDLELPPITTKNPAKSNNAIQEMKEKDTNEATKFSSLYKFNDGNANESVSIKLVKEDSASKEQRTSPVRRLSLNPTGVRLRTNSPRITSRKTQGHGRRSLSSYSSSSSQRRLSQSSRRSLSQSFAVVKSSDDPQRDFRESMVEMILENNIRAPKDLEELLVCYLSLNSDKYHDLIIKVFRQIWFDFSDAQLK